MTPKSVALVLFDGFELLDVFGPVSLLSSVPDLSITYLGPAAGAVRSAQGAAVIADADYSSSEVADIVMVPGGVGTRAAVKDQPFREWLADHTKRAQVIASVCTGSGLLAAAGILDGYRATSNKRAFAWASSQGTRVDWVAQARWVEDRNRWTSSGVAAGMDMTTALIRHYWGNAAATEAVNRIELEVHADSSWDPFAALNGLA